jgi:hypothetical protein
METLPLNLCPHCNKDPCECEPVTYCDFCQAPLFAWNFNEDKCVRCGQKSKIYKEEKGYDFL